MSAACRLPCAKALVAMFGVLTLLAGCGRETPTMPTPPASTAPPTNLPPASAVLGISILGDMWIATTATAVPMTARLITSNTPFEWTDGSDGVAWSVEPAGVAAIDQRGRVTPLNIGTAAVTARYGDKVGTNSIRVLPDYSGNWSGEFVITSCSGGNDPRECGRMMFGVVVSGVATLLKYPFTLALSQARDQVTGTLREPRASGDIIAPVAGLVRQNGMLVIEATVPNANGDPFRIVNWATSANAAVTVMSGAFTQIEPRHNSFNTPYTVRTEQEFSAAAKVP